MATLRVSHEVLEELVFGFSKHPVRIASVREDGECRTVIFEVEGADVPEVAEVMAICNIQQNRAGQRLVNMTFEPAGGRSEPS